MTAGLHTCGRQPTLVRRSPLPCHLACAHLPLDAVASCCGPLIMVAMHELRLSGTVRTGSLNESACAGLALQAVWAAAHLWWLLGTLLEATWQQWWRRRRSSTAAQLAACLLVRCSHACMAYVSEPVSCIHAQGTAYCLLLWVMQTACSHAALSCMLPRVCNVFSSAAAHHMGALVAACRC